MSNQTTMTVRDDQTRELISAELSPATKRLLIACYRDQSGRASYPIFASSSQARAAVVLALLALDAERSTSGR